VLTTSTSRARSACSGQICRHPKVAAATAVIVVRVKTVVIVVIAVIVDLVVIAVVIVALVVMVAIGIAVLVVTVAIGIVARVVTAAQIVVLVVMTVLPVLRPLRRSRISSRPRFPKNLATSAQRPTRRLTTQAPALHAVAVAANPCATQTHNSTPVSKAAQGRPSPRGLLCACQTPSEFDVAQREVTLET
jgi:hypothetical protein